MRSDSQDWETSDVVVGAEALSSHYPCRIRNSVTASEALVQNSSSSREQHCLPAFICLTVIRSFRSFTRSERVCLMLRTSSTEQATK